MPIDLAYLIDICRAFQQDKQYIDGLHQFLLDHQVETILDVCGGSGFPILDLKKRGWNATYADGSSEMLATFSQKAVQAGLAIPCYLSDWQDLRANIPGKFDLLLCRSNSLVYIDSWGSNNISATTLAHIKSSLQSFYQMLNDGGILYIDMYSKELQQLNGTVTTPYDDLIIDGQRFSYSHEINQNDETRIRTWKPIITIEGQRHEFVLQSYYLTHEALIVLLSEVGFEDIEETVIDGENVYTVYKAIKHE